MITDSPIEAHDMRTGDLFRALADLDMRAAGRPLEALEARARAVIEAELRSRPPWPER